MLGSRSCTEELLYVASDPVSLYSNLNRFGGDKDMDGIGMYHIHGDEPLMTLRFLYSVTDCNVITIRYCEATMSC